MPTPTEPIWPCDPHTEAKHQILEAYLEQWLPTLLQGGFRGVTYAEGFAGSGVYTGGEPGSPIRALRAFLGQRSLLERGKTIDMVLIEEDRRRIEILKGEMDKALVAHSPIPETLRPPRYSCSDHAESLIPILESIGAFNRPIFAFLDSFGGSDIPLDIARTIAAAPASEVFVTFGTNYLMRFGEKNSSRQEGDKVFGSTEWHDVFQLPAHQKKTYLVSTYRQSLKRAGFKFVTSFEMLDEGGHPLHLVHGTTHLRGLEKMKNAMWTVDPVRGVRFRDPRDPNQGLLEFSLQPDIGPLRRALLAKLADNVQSVAQVAALCALRDSLSFSARVAASPGTPTNWADRAYDIGSLQ